MHRFFGALFVTSNTYFYELVGIQNELHRLCGIDGDPLLKRNGTIYEGKIWEALGRHWKFEKYIGFKPFKSHLIHHTAQWLQKRGAVQLWFWLNCTAKCDAKNGLNPYCEHPYTHAHEKVLFLSILVWIVTEVLH